MKNKLIVLLALILGAVIGAGVVWVKSYNTSLELPDQQILLEGILDHSAIVIAEEHYACEGKPLKTVGAVVASLIESNKRHTRNVLSYGCYNSVCTMSVTDCKPWQSSECGSRFLRFDLNVNGNIDEKSFSCFDMP
ncbi:MAG: hypothetical protein ACRBBR_15025 [Cellvibrionaceae bacterium]